MTSYCDISVKIDFDIGADASIVGNLIRDIQIHPDITKAKRRHFRFSEDRKSFQLSGAFTYDNTNTIGRRLAVENVISIVTGMLSFYDISAQTTFGVDGELYTPIGTNQDAAHIAYEAETVYQIVVNDQKQYRFLNREDSKKVKQLTVAQLNAIVNFSEIEYRWKAGFFTAGKVGLYNVHVNNEGFVTAFRNARDEGFSVMEKYLSGE